MYQQIQNETEKLRESFDALRGELEDCHAVDDSRIDMDAQINTPVPLSISELIGRIEATLNIVEGFKKDSGKHLVPLRSVINLQTTIQNVTKQIDSILQQFENLEPNGGITTIQGDTIEIHTPNGVLLSVSTALAGVFDPADQMLEHALNIHKLLSSKGFSDFSGVLEGWSSAYAKIKKEREEIVEIIGDAREKQTAVKEAYDYIVGASDSVTSIMKAAEESNTKKDQEINNINAKIEQIREITKDADTLRATVREYESEFASFDQALESRNKNYDAARKNLEESMQYINGSKITVEERIGESEALLAGATNSALASRYGELLDKLEGNLKNAAWAFYISIGFMAITCLPILDYFIPFIPRDILVGNGANTTTGAPDNIRDFIIRAILLLPASWLTIFNAKKYANLFKLKEHYAYKYAIASSVEGFKKQAPKYEEAIAFSAFHELSFNPAYEIDGKKIVAHHPISDLASKVMESLKNGLVMKEHPPSNEQ